MSKDVATVAPETSAADAARIMATRRVRRIPVLDHGRLVGILSKTDLLRACPAGANPFSAQGADDSQLGFSVRQVMTPRCLTVEADAPIEVAARMLDEHRLGALPVVRRGQLVGVISQTDISRAFTEMVFAKHAHRITAEVTAPSNLGQTIVAACAHAGVELRTLMTFEHEERHLVVVSVTGPNVDPLLDALRAAGCRILHVAHADP